MGFGDFSRYTIGTNSNFSEWSGIKKGEEAIDRDAIFYSQEGIMDTAHRYAETAKKTLEILPDKNVKRILLNLPDLIMARAGFK